MVQSAVEPPPEGRTHAGDHAPAPGTHPLGHGDRAHGRPAELLQQCAWHADDVRDPVASTPRQTARQNGTAEQPLLARSCP